MMYRASRRAAALVTGAVIISASGLVAAQPVSEPMNEHPNPYTTTGGPDVGFDERSRYRSRRCIDLGRGTMRCEQLC